ncbi:hypothetical protein QR680_017486 [Steinernema hermaphroditum]|uniref:Serine/threonine-protein phosphatase 1 regulatory subunit 10 n=1 Tax=Steinernema hermaphroditum TaxID=289476 RepID=A0AA39HFR8_9BILA|nr:hypothetical protein QR680_017486 [Steinernema hermaphroditum]
MEDNDSIQDASNKNPESSSYLNSSDEAGWYAGDEGRSANYEGRGDDPSSVYSQFEHYGDGASVGRRLSDMGFDEEDEEEDEDPPGSSSGTVDQYESCIMLLDSTHTSGEGENAKPAIKLVVKRKLPQASVTEEPSGPKPKMESQHPAQSPEPKQAEVDIQRDVARQASVSNKRFDTDEWKRMSSQLKMADRSGNTIRLCEVLRNCIKKEATLELLKSNDTAKVVKTMAKKSFNPEVKKLSQQLVNKWKDVIESTTENTVNQKTEVGVGASSESGGDKKAHKRPMATLINEDIFAPKTVPVKKKERPRTARIPPTKFRSTGLEGDEPGPSTSVAVAKRKGEPVSGKATAPVVPPKKPAPNLKPTTRAVLSTGFMDDIVAQKKVVKAQPKIRRPEIVPAPVLPGRATSTTNSGSPRHEEEIPAARSPEIVEPGRRRVHFADDKGKELVAVRYFEIEEGERINVNNINKMSAEEMKHLEMRDERSHLKNQPVRPGHDATQFWHKSSSSKPSLPWRIHPVYVAEPIVVVCNSKAVQEEKERQRCVMAVFVDPNVPMNISGEPDEEDRNRVVPGLLTEPITIPTEPTEEDDPMEDSSEPAAPVSQTLYSPSVGESAPATSGSSKIVTPEIQNIMNHLRQSGAVASIFNQNIQEPPVNQAKLCSTRLREEDRNELADILSRVQSNSVREKMDQSGPQEPPPHSEPYSTGSFIPTIPTDNQQAQRTAPYQPDLYQSHSPQAIGASSSSAPHPSSSFYRPTIPSIPTEQSLPRHQVYSNSPQSPPRVDPNVEPGTSSMNRIAILNNFDVHTGVDSRPPGDDSYVDNYQAPGLDGYPPVNGPAPGGGIRQCTYFMKGQCHFGDKCMNGHGDIPTAGSRGMYARGRGRGMPSRGRGGPVNGGYGPPPGPEFDSRRVRGRGRSPPPRRFDRRYDRYRPRSRSRSPSYSPPRRSPPDYRRRRDRSRSPERRRCREPPRRGRERSRSPPRRRSRSPPRSPPPDFSSSDSVIVIPS